jgi:nucleoside-diphosphate-sugar epimerase
MIVVTGAGGRLGRLVADRLVSAGKDVVGTDRVPADSPDFKFSW